MPIDPKSVSKMAHDYTAAWNSKSAEAVASFFDEDGQIAINGGDPWKGRSGIAEMATGFHAEVRTFRSPAMRSAAREPTPSMSGPSLATTPRPDIV